jgi:hypothetical protein
MPGSWRRSGRGVQPDAAAALKHDDKLKKVVAMFETPAAVPVGVAKSSGVADAPTWTLALRLTRSRSHSVYLPLIPRGSLPIWQTALAIEEDGVSDIATLQLTSY